MDWDIDTGEIGSILEFECMRQEDKRRKDAHMRMMVNLARMIWVVKGIGGRYITASSVFAARDRAVEAYVRLRQVTSEELEILEGVIIRPDYRLVPEKRCYELVMTMELYGSEPQVIRSADIIDDTLCISTEHFYIQFSIQTTDTEKSEMERFKTLTANIDPLQGDADGP